MKDITTRIREACTGHPFAKIRWPHNLLHDAADEIELLRAKLQRVEPAIRDCQSLDLDGHICEKSAAIKAVRDAVS